MRGSAWVSHASASEGIVAAPSACPSRFGRSPGGPDLSSRYDSIRPCAWARGTGRRRRHQGGHSLGGPRHQAAAATKTIPKGMLPIIDKPVVQYIVEEAVAAGLSDVLMITSSGQQSITDHFDPTPGLRTRLATAGEHQALADIR